MKRVLSFLLVLCMVVAMLPVGASAQEARTDLVNNGMTVEGTNSFGTLLSNEIMESQEVSDYQAGYSVTELSISGSTATVTYDALEEATLVVAVYTEDGLQLLASGRATVSPDETEATVTIDGTMPEYFYATAYLLDTHDYVPLCEEFSTPMYTREMQTLLASTVEDYDADRVYNLDGDTTTNFAVFAEDTIVIREQAGVNTVVSADDDARIYVIENADATVTSLTAGDVLAYPYGEGEILIVKVASITVDGTTATITGGSLEMEDAFAYVKIESAADTSDFSVDTSNLGDGVTHMGLITSPEVRAISGNDSSEEFYGIEIEQDALSGSLGIRLEANVEFYVSMSHQYLEATVDGYASFTLTISGNKEYRLAIGEYAVSPLPGLYIGIEPTAVYRFEGNATFTFGYNFTIGFAVERNNGGPLSMQNRSSNPTLNQELKFSGSIFVGFDMNPQISILSDSVFNAGLNTLVGIELSGVLEYNNDTLDQSKDIIHSCESCVDGDITLVIELTVYAQFLGSDKWTLDEKILDFHGKIGKFYWSLDKGTFALTSCPHRSYRVSIEVVDTDGNPVPSVPVTVSNGEVSATNPNGIAVFYLPAGGHTVSAQIDGALCDVVFYVKHMARKVVLSADSQDEDQPVFINADSDIFMDADTVIGHGSWGTTVYWALYGDGTMHIYGEGAMPLCTDAKYVPWHDYRTYITSLVIDDGVTEVGAYTFYYCTNLKEVRLPEGLLVISNRSFEGCAALEAVALPDSLTEIEDNAFNGCVKLTEVTIPCNLGNYVFEYCTGLEKVTILDGVTYIGVLAFGFCSGLPEVTIPTSVTRLAYRAFDSCTSLKEIVIPGSITEIEKYTFYGCTALERVEIQNGVETIGYQAFKNCTALAELHIAESVNFIAERAFESCTKLTEVTIPGNTDQYVFLNCTALEKVVFLDSVTSIGKYAFKDCTSLSDVIIPDSVTSIGEAAFIGCTGLYEIVIPASITTISNSVFNGCTALSGFTIPETVTSIGGGAFKGCVSLTEIVIPDSVTYIGGSAFQGCTGLQEIFIPSSVTSYGNYSFADCTGLERVVFEDGATIVGYAAFDGCTSLHEVVIPESVTSIDSYAFMDCASLTEITLPTRITKLNTGLFKGCTALNNVIIPENVEAIRGSVFYDCVALAEITIPGSVLSIDDYAFYDCTNLNVVIFRGNPTTVGRAPFYHVVATAYYPADNTRWTDDVMKKYGGTLTWVPYTLDGSGNMVTNETAAVTMAPSGEAIPAPEEEAVSQALEEVSTVLTETPELPAAEPFSAADLLIPEEPDEDMTPDAIFGGDYTTEVVENSYILKTATFSGLVPGEEYVMLALVSLDADDVLAADNLLGILQGTAEADGTLKFQYVQRVDTDVSYVVACGASNKNLKDATITFPEMTADGNVQAVNPTVVYGGVTLTEGVDYEISGTVDFTAGGTYTCQIRGIHNYTGTVTCTYTVTEVTVVLGDVNGDEEIDILDANLVVAWYNEVRELEDDQLLAADVNDDGEVDIMDANMIVAYYNEVIDAFPTK